VTADAETLFGQLPDGWLLAEQLRVGDLTP